MGDSNIGGGLLDPFGQGALKKGRYAQEGYTALGNQALTDSYNKQMKILQPWNTAGVEALGGMQGQDFQRDFTASDFQNDPGYEFRMAEGQKALERSAAARGRLKSGGTMKAISRYGQDYASNEFGNAYNRFNADRDRRFSRLGSIAGLGSNATGQMVNATGQYGANMSNNYTGLGNAIGGNYAALGMANQGQTAGFMRLGGMVAGGSGEK